MQWLPGAAAHRRVGAALLAALVGGLGCSDSSESRLEDLRRAAHPSGVKVLLLGIDGATGQLLEPLMEEGKLPHFARLRREGTYGTLLSQKPMRSPAVWTTIATGKDREEHGIVHFLTEREPGEATLVTSLDRRVLALWNIASAFRRTVGIVAWWATWPAEPVRGFMVSDRMTRSLWGEWTEAERSHSLTFPPDLESKLRRLVTDLSRPPMDEILELVDLTPGEQAELLAFDRPLKDHGLSVLKFTFAEQRTYERILLRQLERGQPDLTAALLIGNDPISHTFWHHYEPEAFPGFDAEASPRLGRLIPNFYVHNDRFLEQVLARVDPETVVIVISDHGFKASGQLPQTIDPALWAEYFERERALLGDEGVAVGRSGRHRLEGVFLAAGGPIRPGVAVTASVRDVAPTVLALLGLPVPADMPGRVLEEILDPAFLERHPLRSLPSYEGLIERAEPSKIPGRDDPERLEMLRALGYVE